MFGNLFGKNLVDMLPKVRGKYLKNVPMSKHTWFGVGGPAEIMFVPEDIEDLQLFMKNKKSNVMVSIVGGGSNLLVRDGGIPGVVIKLDSPFFNQHIIDKEKGTITCYAGKKNMTLRKVLIDNEISGIEFLCSIPGAIGGCVKTNAGCFGFEVKDKILEAQIIDGEGSLKTIGVDDLKLSYRTSFFPDDWIIVSITFKVTNNSKEEITALLDQHKAYRNEKQPFNARTAGSTFKNPTGLRAWELIKKSGADKLKVGGAEVSEKHCNFLINTGNATAADIETLGEKIVQTVKEKTSITLEWEVKRIGIKK